MNIVIVLSGHVLTRSKVEPIIPCLMLGNTHIDRNKRKFSLRSLDILVHN